MTFQLESSMKPNSNNPETKTDQMINQLFNQIEKEKEQVKTPRDEEHVQLKKTRITVKKRVKKTRPEGYDPIQKRE